VVARHKAALNSAAHLALAKGDLEPETHGSMLDLLNDRPSPLQAYTLSVMNVALVGIVLFIAAPGPRVIAYVAEDPEHPLKAYPSPQAFMAELTRQLRDKARLPGVLQPVRAPMPSAGLFLPGSMRASATSNGTKKPAPTAGRAGKTRRSATPTCTSACNAGRTIIANARRHPTRTPCGATCIACN